MVCRKDSLAVGARALRRVFSLGADVDARLRELAAQAGVSDSEVVRCLILSEHLFNVQPTEASNDD